MAGRDQLWSLIYNQQGPTALFRNGFGFGVNLPYLVGDYPGDQWTRPVAEPAQLASRRPGPDGTGGYFPVDRVVAGLVLALVVGCRRLARRGLHVRRQVAVLCLMVTTAILVSSFFDPQLEGAQVAALLWTAFGVGVAVTSFRGWFRWPTQPRPQRNPLHRPALSRRAGTASTQR